MLNTEHQAAIDLALRAQAIAEPLGALDALSDALNSQGCSVAETGGEWTGYLRRALEVALSAGLDEQAARAYANLSATYADRRRFAEASGTSPRASPTATSTKSVTRRAYCGGNGWLPGAGRALG